MIVLFLVRVLPIFLCQCLLPAVLFITFAALLQSCVNYTAYDSSATDHAIERNCTVAAHSSTLKMSESPARLDQTAHVGL